MRRGAHLFLLCALLPGVILPAQFALCLGGGAACGVRDGCCAEHGVPLVRRSCCATRACHEKPGGKRTVISEKNACHCCLVLAPTKPVTPKPETHQGAPDFAHPDVIACAIDAPPAKVEAVLPIVPVGLSPPGDARTLPLLI